jgi:hypothetical protein
LSTCSPAAADVIFSHDESEVIDSFFQDSICPEEKMGYNEDGAGIDIVHRQKDRANGSVATKISVSVLAIGVGGQILTTYMGRLSKARWSSQLLQSVSIRMLVWMTTAHI